MSEEQFRGRIEAVLNGEKAPEELTGATSVRCTVDHVLRNLDVTYLYVMIATDFKCGLGARSGERTTCDGFYARGKIHGIHVNMVKPPRFPGGHEERQTDLEQEKEEAFIELVELSLEAGYTEEEAMAALASLEENWQKARAENEKTMDAILKAKRSPH